MGVSCLFRASPSCVCIVSACFRFDILDGPPNQETFGRGLITDTNRREGEKIMDVSCLWYDDEETLNAFLRHDGHEGCVKEKIDYIVQIYELPVEWLLFLCAWRSSASWPPTSGAPPCSLKTRD